MSIQDGSVIWQKDFMMGLRKIPLVVGYNKRQTFTSSGTFTPTMTGLYKITLIGGGGGGYGAETSTSKTGASGGSGAELVAYENLSAGMAYPFVIGAGGTGANNNDTVYSAGNGGDTTITIGNNSYIAGGGGGGKKPGAGYTGGEPGQGKINAELVTVGFTGNNGGMPASGTGIGPTGAGHGGNNYPLGVYYDGFGGGGCGNAMWGGSAKGGDGASGRIIFEWFDPSEAFPDIWNVLEPSE